MTSRRAVNGIAWRVKTSSTNSKDTRSRHWKQKTRGSFNKQAGALKKKGLCKAGPCMPYSVASEASLNLAALGSILEGW
jgi:hypothetical protein